MKLKEITKADIEKEIEGLYEELEKENWYPNINAIASHIQVLQLELIRRDIKEIYYD